MANAEVKPMFGPDGPQPDQCGLAEGRPEGPWLVSGPRLESLGGDQMLCGVCRFPRQLGEHCYLYERCTDCGNIENPCPVAKAIQGS